MINKIKQFYEDVVREMNKVSWPERDEVINSTFVVFVFSAIFTIFIWLADLAISNLVSLLYS